MDKIMVKSVDVDCRIQVTVINKDDSLHIFTHTCFSICTAVQFLKFKRFLQLFAYFTVTKCTSQL